MSILVQQFLYHKTKLGIEKRIQSNKTKMHENTNEKILTEKNSRKWQAREELEKG